MLCSIEGQTFPVDDDIAASDEKLKDILRPHIPNVEGAQIVREAGKPIEIVLKPGTKGIAVEGRRQGMQVLQALIESKEEINPALTINWTLQNLERKGELNPLILAQMYPEIASAIAQGEEQLAAFNKSLSALKSAPNSASNAVPFGF